jgi:hypothetical protein
VTEPTKEKWRANYVAAPHYFLLDQACRIVNDAFGSCCYLVGSALKRRDYRDVDVRLILPDEEFAGTFPGIGSSYPANARWSLLCCSISRFLSEASGLPVDFQFQQRTLANAQHDGERHPLGMFHAMKEHEPYPGGGE